MDGPLRPLASRVLELLAVLRVSLAQNRALISGRHSVIIPATIGSLVEQ
jgi:hypothetical protein